MAGPGMEQPAARVGSNRMGLVFTHLNEGKKLMLYRLRQKDGQ